MAKKSCAAINKENNSNNINSINSNNSKAVNNLAADKAKTQTKVAAVNGTKGQKERKNASKLYYIWSEVRSFNEKRIHDQIDMTELLFRVSPKNMTKKVRMSKYFINLIFNSKDNQSNKIRAYPEG